MIKSPWPSSDLNHKYGGFTSFKGKLVLDLGSDRGSTALFFLKNGASSVVCVDESETFLTELRQSQVKLQLPIEIVKLSLSRTTLPDLIELIKVRKPEIVKCDLGGKETLLLSLPYSVFRLVPTYLIHPYSYQDYRLFQHRAQEWGYKFSCKTLPPEKADSLPEQDRIHWSFEQTICLEREETFPSYPVIKPYVAGESYPKTYGRVSYKGKVVIDLGTDWGSSAEFFAHEGASKIVCVDFNSSYLQQLEENVAKYNWPVEIVRKQISSSLDFSFLIETYKPDVLKCDCDGCEKFFFDLPCEVMRKVPIYVFETHSVEWYFNLKAKAEECGFSFVSDSSPSSILAHREHYLKLNLPSPGICVLSFLYRL